MAYATMRFVAVLLLCASMSTVSGRVLRQQGGGSSMPSEAMNSSSSTGGGGVGSSPAPTASYATFNEAVQAANTTANLTTLVAALEAAGVLNAINDTTAWTILAPTNQAFDTRLAALNITPAALLNNATNRPLLVQILSFHVIPEGAFISSNLTDGMNVSTALASAGNLTVRLNGTNVTFVGPTNNATVETPDIRAGASVIHVVNDVLVPPMNATSNTTSGGGSMPGMVGGAGGAGNTTAGTMAPVGAGADNMTAGGAGAGALYGSPAPATAGAGNTTSA